MNPIKAQRIWHTLSTKWINATPYGYSPFRHPRRKIKKGILTNLIPVEVVNAITGEISKGYMRDLSAKKLRKWLEYRNQRAEVEQLFVSVNSTFHHFAKGDFENFPILIKLGTYQVPYLIDHTRKDKLVKGKWTIVLELKIVDNLNYLEIVAKKKKKVMALFNKIKRQKKNARKKLS